MELNSLNTMLCFCAGFAVLFVWIGFYPSNLNFLMNRISIDSGYDASQINKDKKHALLGALLPLAQKFSEKNHKKVSQKTLAKIDADLEAAGRPLQIKAIDFYNIKFAGAIAIGVFGVILGVVGGFNPMMCGVGGAVAGFLLPLSHINSLIKERSNTANIEIPDILDLLSVCMVSGMTLTGAMKVVCERNSGLVIDELRTVQNDVLRGASMTNAFYDMTRRCRSDIVNQLYQNIELSEALGKPIAGPLKTLSNSVRESSFEMIRQRAAKASVKVLMPLVFFILPSVMVIVMGPLVMGVK